MRYRSTAAILLIVGSAATAAAAQAATTDDIRHGIQDWVENALLQATAGVTATLEGAVAVTEDGAGFRAVLPPIRLAFVSGAEIAVGSIEIDLQPLVGGGYAANWTIPGAIQARARDGTAVIVTAGTRSGTGIFAPELGLMMLSELELRDIEASVDGRPRHLAIDSLVFSSRYDPVGQDLFDQSTEIRVAGLTGLREDGTEAIRIDGIGLSGGGHRVDLSAWRDFRTALGTAAGPRDKSGTPPQPGLADPTGGRPALLAAFEGRHRVEGLHVDLHGADLSIDRGNLTVSMAGLDTGTASLAVAFSLSGLDLPPAIGPMEPREMAVDVALTGLPTDRLIDAMAAAIAGTGMSNTGRALATFNMHLQDAMMTSGARIEVRDIHLVAEDASLSVAGTIKPTHAAPLGLVAELDMTITGLEALIARARGRPGSDRTLRQLALLQRVGVSGTDRDGMPARTYALRITNQGRMLLNGSDLIPALASPAP